MLAIITREKLGAQKKLGSTPLLLLPVCTWDGIPPKAPQPMTPRCPPPPGQVVGGNVCLTPGAWGLRGQTQAGLSLFSTEAARSASACNQTLGRGWGQLGPQAIGDKEPEVLRAGQ